MDDGWVYRAIRIPGSKQLQLRLKINIHESGSFTKPTKMEASTGLSSGLHIIGALFGGHSWFGLWQNLGQVPSLLWLPQSLPEAANIEVNNVAANPQAGVERGPEITIIKPCLMPG